MRIIPLFLGLLLSALPFAATAQLADQSFKDWKTFTYTTGANKKLCYAATFATRSGGDAVRATQPYITITALGDKKAEININFGYALKQGSNANVSIDQHNYKLFTRDDAAWAASDEDDAAIISSMIKGEVMDVGAQAGDGKKSEDRYSLMGIYAAYQRVMELCR